MTTLIIFSSLALIHRLHHSLSFQRLNFYICISLHLWPTNGWMGDIIRSGASSEQQETIICQSSATLPLFTPLPLPNTISPQSPDLACCSIWTQNKVLACSIFHFVLRDSASSFHWLSSSIFSCSFLRSSSRIGNISSHLHYMMFPSIQTIYFLWGYDPGNMSVSTYLLLLSWAQFTVV